VSVSDSDIAFIEELFAPPKAAGRWVIGRFPTTGWTTRRLRQTGHDKRRQICWARQSRHWPELAIPAKTGTKGIDP